MMQPECHAERRGEEFNEQGTGRGGQGLTQRRKARKGEIKGSTVVSLRLCAFA